MQAELKLEFDNAMADAAEQKTLCAAAGPVGAIWGVSITAILKLVLDKALELGKAYRPEIEAAGKAAVDRLVALDLPWVPEGVEGVIDEATHKLGYAAVEAALDAVLGKE